jgi:hypothetical protein
MSGVHSNSRWATLTLRVKSYSHPLPVILIEDPGEPTPLFLTGGKKNRSPDSKIGLGTHGASKR